MCSIIIEDIFDELKEENKRLSEELAFIREKQKVFIQFQNAFDLYSNKIKQSLESNEWQIFEILLTKLNDIQKTPINIPEIYVKHEIEYQEVSHLSNKANDYIG